MPVVVVGRGDVRPPSAGERPDEPRNCDPFGQRAAGFGSQQVKETDEGESRTWAASTHVSNILGKVRCRVKEEGVHTGGNGDKEHEKGPFGISVANGGRDGREPLVWIAVPLIFDNLVVM